MAFKAGTITATMKLDRKGFKRDLKRAGGDAKRFKLDMGKLFKTGLFGAGLTIATRQMFKFVEAGATLSTLTDAFETMTKASGVSGDEILKLSKIVTRALSKEALIRAGNMLELLGVGVARLPRFVEIARAAGIGLGRSTAFMLESLATGTARQSRLWLDNLGIIISIGDANKAFAKQLGITTNEMTDQQKRGAFLNAVLSKGGELIDKVGAKSETQAEKVAAFTASWTDLKDSVAVFTAETLGIPALLSGVARGIDEVVAAAKRAKTFAARQRERGVTPGGAGFGTGGRGLAEFAPGIERLRPRQEAVKALNMLFVPTGPGGAATRTAITARVAAALEVRLDALIAAGAEVVAKGTIQGGRHVGRSFLQGGAGGGRFVGPRLPGGFISGGIDQAIPDDPGGITQSMDEVANSTNLATNAVSGLGDALGNMAEAFVTGGDANRVFAASILNTFSSLAGQLGDLYIQAGIGMIGLGTLSPFASIAAGVALKAIAGIFRGGAINNAPSAGFPRALRTPLNTTGEAGGSVVNIHVDNFIGNRAWLDALTREINKYQRNNGRVEVFI